MLDRLSPKLRDRLASRPRPLPGLDGLHLLLGHAESGANLLAEAGMPADVVWLVRNHERRADSVSLRALQTADHRH
jgi:HD-like signal output (HDOD) protein